MGGGLARSRSPLTLFHYVTTALLLSIFTSHPSIVNSASLPQASVDGSPEDLAGPEWSKYNYSEALRLSLLFYEAQRSGKLPENNRVHWRGDSALDDKGIDGEDLSGGYYDAADYVKFVWTQAGTSTVLAWGMLNGVRGYKGAGLLDQGLACLKWATDFLIKCHVAPDELYGQVGDFSIDQNYWGRPEEMNMSRPAYKLDASKPASDVASEVSAALAAASIAFKMHGDPDYAELCLRHAMQLYQFANKHRGLYHLSMKSVQQFHESSCYGDELAWASAWLYKATNSSFYLEEALNHYNVFRLKERPNEFSTGHRVAGVQVLLAEFTDRTEFKKQAKQFCEFQAKDQRRSPKGLLCIERFGALEHAANVAFLCLQVANLGIATETSRILAKQQIDYMLGDGGRSYVVGFGHNPPTQPHHAASSCPSLPASCGWEQFRSKEPNPQILYGALVSGPDEIDTFDDRRVEYVFTEVNMNFNAGFQGALALLLDLQQVNGTKIGNDI